MSFEEGQGTPVVTDTPAPIETPNTPEAPAPSETPEAPVAGATDNSGATAAASEFKPDFKFKVMDKEHEVDEWLRTSVKNKEHEEKLKELYTKAHGLDHVKPKYETERQTREVLEKEFTGFKQEITQILQMRDAGLQQPLELEGFFKATGIPDEALAKYLLAKHQISQLPEDQQRLYNENKQVKNRVSEQEKQIQQANQMYQQAARQARQVELDSVLARADINQYATNYDQAAKKQGAFREAVRKFAIAEFHTTGKDLTAEEAASAVMSFLGEAYKAKPASTPQAVPNKELPVLPNVGGKNISPTDRIPKSLEDIKKLHREMSASQ